MVAVAGARGGVGSSIVAVNLAVYLAQLGRKVLVVDVNASGGELHTMVDVRLTGAPDTDELEEESLDVVPTPLPGLSLLPQTYTHRSTAPTRPGRKPRWAKGLRELDFEHVILDLGAGTLPATLDLYLTADLGVCVTSPEPPSVEGTYRFARAVFQRQLRRALIKDQFRGRLLERAQRELAPLAPPQEIVRTIAGYDVALAEVAAQELAKMRPRLIVNKVRSRGDNDLGPGICDLGMRHLGVRFDYVGSVEHDDSVWLSVTRRRPLLVDSPTSKGARNIERIARRLLAVAAARETERVASPIPLVAAQPTLYDILFVHRGSSDEELRRAYRRQVQLYHPDSLAITSLLGEDQLDTERARIDEAHATLLDPLKRRAYDVSTFPDEEDARESERGPEDHALEQERAMLREELAREITAETRFDGALLRKVRESRGVELEDISLRTKISRAHLNAIEEDDYSSLPAFVYLRGFLQEISKFLKLDPTQVSRSYLVRYRDWRRKQADAS